MSENTEIELKTEIAVECTGRCARCYRAVKLLRRGSQIHANKELSRKAEIGIVVRHFDVWEPLQKFSELLETRFDWDIVHGDVVNEKLRADDTVGRV